MRRARQDASDTSRRGRVTMLRQMRSVQDSYDEQIAAVLTREQAQELKTIREERLRQLQSGFGKRR